MTHKKIIDQKNLLAVVLLSASSVYAGIATADTMPPRSKPWPTQEIVSLMPELFCYQNYAFHCRITEEAECGTLEEYAHFRIELDMQGRTFKLVGSAPSGGKKTLEITSGVINTKGTGKVMAKTEDYSLSLKVEHALTEARQVSFALTRLTRTLKAVSIDSWMGTCDATARGQ